MREEGAYPPKATMEDFWSVDIDEPINLILQSLLAIELVDLVDGPTVQHRLRVLQVERVVASPQLRVEVVAVVEALVLLIASLMEGLTIVHLLLLLVKIEIERRILLVHHYLLLLLVFHLMLLLAHLDLLLRQQLQLLHLLILNLLQSSLQLVLLVVPQTLEQALQHLLVNLRRLLRLLVQKRQQVVLALLLVLDHQNLALVVRRLPWLSRELLQEP